jgi:hypothetical protein
VQSSEVNLGLLVKPRPPPPPSLPQSFPRLRVTVVDDAAIRAAASQEGKEEPATLDTPAERRHLTGVQLAAAIARASSGSGVSLPPAYTRAKASLVDHDAGGSGALPPAEDGSDGEGGGAGSSLFHSAESAAAAGAPVVEVVEGPEAFSPVWDSGAWLWVPVVVAAYDASSDQYRVRFVTRRGLLGSRRALELTSTPDDEAAGAPRYQLRTRGAGPLPLSSTGTMRTLTAQPPSLITLPASASAGDKWVKRLHLRFASEPPELFEARRANALGRRELAKNCMRFIAYLHTQRCVRGCRMGYCTVHRARCEPLGTPPPPAPSLQCAQGLRGRPQPGVGCRPHAPGSAGWRRHCFWSQ